MNLKAKVSHDTHSSSESKNSLNFSGGGRVAVSVVSIVNSPKVQRQVAEVKQIEQQIKKQ